MGIVRAEGAEVDELERWFSEDQDVRVDVSIAGLILTFIDQHAAKTVAMADRILGCPHEEGKDYPEGQKCPQCPFWAVRDRWSGEIIQ